jgi:hypothetical protein
MSDLEFSGTNLLALTLVRALALELPNTREACLRHPSNSVLAHEVRRPRFRPQGAVKQRARRLINSASSSLK